MIIMLIPLLSVFWLRSLGPVEARAATRDNVGCSFHLSCSGGFNGSIGEKGSGQARASSGGSPSLFTWFGDAFADQQGSGCWWTPPTFTLQCDKNQPPDHGFQIGCDGTLSFNGQTVFYECPTGQGDEVNIYLHPNGNQCHTITIQADSCAPTTCPGGGISPSPGGGGGAGPVPGATSSPSSSVPTTPSTLATSPILPTSSPPTNSSAPPTSSTLPGPPTPSPFTTGPGNDQTTTTSITSTSTVTTTQPAPTSSSSCTTVVPDQIILTDKGNPDMTYGPNSGMNIQVSPNASSIFNFHFSDSDLGKICEISFLLPNSNTNADGTPYNLTGTGFVTFSALDGWANANTTYGNSPRIIETISNAPLYAGVGQGFGRFACPGSTSRTSVLLTEAPMADTCLNCVQGAVGDGIGMYLQKC
ncbi:ubiquitin 3 binding protein But2 C-terminal domain-containing protein [Xylariaceae sp. AK1471]|nr:ubiquitin 3 binding protein But2 C-terminal domain-containing protein [Xylariaceae sp. AK1471]